MVSVEKHISICSFAIASRMVLSREAFMFEQLTFNQPVEAFRVHSKFQHKNIILNTTFHFPDCNHQQVDQQSAFSLAISGASAKLVRFRFSANCTVAGPGHPAPHFPPSAREGAPETRSNLHFMNISVGGRIGATGSPCTWPRFGLAFGNGNEMGIAGG